MNKKGQALVFTILLIPIIIIIFIGTIESVNINYQKKRITSNIKTIIKSCFDKCSDEEIMNLLKENDISYKKLDITRDNNLAINIKAEVATIINDDYILNISLVGTKDNENINIKKG